MQRITRSNRQIVVYPGVLKCTCGSKQPVTGAKRHILPFRFTSRYLLTPFQVPVSTELEITPPASRVLNAKLYLVNKAACFDRFFPQFGLIKL